MPRRIPQQKRGERRVAALLDSAASVIAECGYEAATMSSIAERAGASIGSLYQFFPNKESVTQALRTQYGKQFEELWAPLEAEAKTLSLGHLVNRFVDMTIDFVDDHPALLPLMDAPSTTRNPPIRRHLRKLVASFFLAKRPRMSKAKALRFATVTLQIIRGLNAIYVEAGPEEKAYFVHEFKVVLLCYFTSKIGLPDASDRKLERK
ncbi:MAG: TetR/AcrR family transcriptional regulator [Bryobacteraceae bacterium]